MTDINKRFIEQACASLDERAEKYERLKPHLSTRLRAVRNQAMESQHQHFHRGWMPAMASAFAVVMAVGIWFVSFNDVQDVSQDISVAQLNYESRPADLEMLVAANGLELFGELDFYYWLEQKERRAS